MINSIRKIFSILLFFFAALGSKSQIITVNTNLQIPCCNYSDSIDLNTDGSFEIKFGSYYLGTIFAFMATSNSEVRLADDTKTFGSSFSYIDTSYNVPLAIANSMSWLYWDPNSGSRYLGFAKINAPADTTFGWVEMDFRGDNSGTNSIYDTVFVKRFSFNTVSNERLTAGQTSPLQISLNEKSDYFTVYPNPSKDFILIETENINSDLEIILSDITGKIILRKENCSLIDVSDFANGIYFITIPELNHTEKIQVLR